MQKIGIIQTAFIGDVVLSTALLESLHKQYPNAVLDLIVRKGNEGLVKEHPFINEVIIWDKQNNKYKNWWKVLVKIRKNKYDVLINVQRFAATGLWLAFSKAKITIGFNKNPFSFIFKHSVIHTINDASHHEVDRNHLLTVPLGVIEKLKPKLYPSKADFEKVKSYINSPYICIAPASVWFTKQYPVDQWIQFINELDFNGNIYIIGGPGDIALSKKIEEGFIQPLAANKQLINLTGQLSLLASAALQQKAVLNYVNDSAPMHFASAMNASVVAIYCSTIPDFGYGPLSTHSFVVQTLQDLDCRPCGLHGKKQCPAGHFNCAYQIQMEQLQAPLLKMQQQ
jgi:heptosyltransferase-2